MAKERKSLETTFYSILNTSKKTFKLVLQLILFFSFFFNIHPIILSLKEKANFTQITHSNKKNCDKSLMVIDLPQSKKKDIWC